MWLNAFLSFFVVASLAATLILAVAQVGIGYIIAMGFLALCLTLILVTVLFLEQFKNFR